MARCVTAVASSVNPASRSRSHTSSAARTGADESNSVGDTANDVGLLTLPDDLVDAGADAVDAVFVGVDQPARRVGLDPQDPVGEPLIGPGERDAWAVGVEEVGVAGGCGMIRFMGAERVPPHNIDVERAVLGAMLMRSEAIGAAVEVIDAGDFYKPAHGHIFDAIVALWASGDAVDPATVAEALRRSGLLDAIGGSNVVVELLSAAPVLGNASAYASIIHESAMLRRLISAGTEIVDIGYTPTDSAAEAIDQAEAIVFSVGQERFTDTTREVQSLVSDALDDLEARYENRGQITGTPSGFKQIDTLLAGFQRTGLYVVGARPAMGKTAFALNVATNAAKAGRPVLFFSLEMSHLEITQRLIAQVGRIDASKMRVGDLSERDWSNVTRAMGKLADLPLWIDDNPNLNVMEIRAKARRLKSRAGDLGMIVVDYLQLMTGRARAENRQVEIAEMSRALKILARELETPVIALSQLSRQLESRADKRPQLSDLRESGALEQDADAVLFLYRDEVYNPDTPDRGMAEIIVAKHRQGPTGIARLVFLAHNTAFADASTDHY